MDICAVNPSGFTGFVAEVTTWNEVEFQNVGSMVARVRERAKWQPGSIMRLSIVDHGAHRNGTPVGFQLGSDLILPTTIARYTRALAFLRPYFAPNGCAYLLHCWAGQFPGLLRSVAVSFGVPVYGFTGKGFLAGGYNFGHMIKAFPDANVAPVDMGSNPGIRFGSFIESLFPSLI